MGLVLLPLAFLIAIGWIGLILLLAFATERAIQKTLKSRMPPLIIYPLFLFLGWYLPNIPGYKKQKQMDAVATHCGWSHVKHADNVPGVYIEGKYRSDYAAKYMDIYKAVEYELEGKIVHSEKTGNPTHMYEHKYFDERTLRFGVRHNLEKFVTTDIWRKEMQVVDFDTQEIIGQRVEYGFYNPPSRPSIFRYAIGILLFQPTRCGYTNPAETDVDTELPQILVPKSS